MRWSGPTRMRVWIWVMGVAPYAGSVAWSRMARLIWLRSVALREGVNAPVPVRACRRPTASTDRSSAAREAQPHHSPWATRDVHPSAPA